MRKLNLGIVVVLTVSAAAVRAGPAASGSQEVFEGISRPSEDRTLAFTRPGKIAKVLVEDGDYVEANQALIQLDNDAEREELARLEAEAKDTIRIRAAKAKLDLSEVVLERKKEAFRDGAVNKLELQEAELDRDMQKLSLELANFEQQQAQRDWNKARIVVERMCLISPIAGRIEGLAVEKGEAAEELARIVRVVKTDPLWIDVRVPLAVARTLRQGNPARAAFGEKKNPEREISDGKIKFVRSVADYASETLEVRLEVPNPSHRPANEKVYVTFPPAEKVSDNNANPKKIAVDSKVKAKE